MLESPAVGKSRREFAQLLGELAERMEKAPQGVPFDDRIGLPYVEMRDRFNDAGKALPAAMRDDLGLISE